jgi:Mor family transcriptional regulator
MEIRRNELLADVADRSTVILRRFGLDEGTAQAAADDIVDDMAANWGGQYITVPKDMKYRHAKRCQAIVSAFTGANHAELAREHGLSVNSIYKILKRDQREHAARRAS